MHRPARVTVFGLLMTLAFVWTSSRAIASNATGSGSYAPNYTLNAYIPTASTDVNPQLTLGNSDGMPPSNSPVSSDSGLLNQIMLTMGGTPVYLPQGAVEDTVNSGLTTLVLTAQDRENVGDGRHSPTPEPASLGLAASAIAGLILARSRIAKFLAV
jgi:hypothetical protein